MTGRWRTLGALAAAGAALTLAACETAGMSNGAGGAGLDMTAGPGGEAGPIRLRDQGFFYVGVRPRPYENADGETVTGVYGQMYVGYELVEHPQHPYPLILVHGGGGQATDYMGAPDGRDGWLDYFLAAGFDVYFVDRPGYGRSPSSRFYGDLNAPPTTQFISGNFTAQSEQYPGTGEPDDPLVAMHTASSGPGPTVPTEVLKEDMAELLDRVGPAILVTHSAGGLAGWVGLDARPDKIKAILTIETFSGFSEGLQHNLTWDPPLGPDDTITVEEHPSTGPGLAPCTRQADDRPRVLPAYKDKPIVGYVAPNSSFSESFHCTIDELNQVGARAELVRLREDLGMEGNGHFMNEELNNGAIAKSFIDWLSTID